MCKRFLLISRFSMIFRACGNPELIKMEGFINQELVNRPKAIVRPDFFY